MIAAAETRSPTRIRANASVEGVNANAKLMIDHDWPI
jgi:hypothetical protein